MANNTISCENHAGTPRLKSKSKRYCSVPQCNTYGDEKNVTIHFFPKDDKLKKKWQQVLKIGKPISKCMTVCSKHFTESDYYPKKLGTKERRLKKNVVPSQNIPLSSVRTKETASKVRRLLVRNVAVLEPTSSDTNLTVLEEVEEDEIPINPHAVTSSRVPTPVDKVENVADESRHCTTCCCYSSSEKSSVYVQTNETGDSSFHFINILNKDENVGPFAGVDLSVVNTIEQSVLKVANHNGQHCDKSRLKIFIVLLKLKLNLSFVCLSILFSISPTTCTRYFYAFLTLMSASLKPFIYWPSKEEILNNMPQCFDSYKNTRIVLDCTEVAVEKCRCLSCRVVTYSHYKGTNTVKFMIGIAPSGLITYLSKGHGGRATDKNIFNKENLLSKFDHGDGIMVDKGFLIEKECEENFLTLIRPPFLRQASQFSKADAEKTANIARARVHVERAIERVKVFKILKHQLPKYLLPYINYIMTIIVALVNLSPPILADEKFITCESEM